MYTNNQTFSAIDSFDKNAQVNSIQETAFDPTGQYHSNAITIQVQLNPHQYANLITYGYSGKLHNVYFTIRSNNHADFYANSTEDIHHLLKVIS
ncbi:hypothetical protein [Niallia sp. MER TA 168]|uniref:hypothetical protein n=1 Tax=Niallia sp. MER TA 168 TaxID=2939568 RepID=UPI00203B203C|nr:hypothetical protein [Niallia sp. MER TA 168]MCM3363407.1 hypothetical protein [Niallia sp. MER TA 168]